MIYRFLTAATLAFGLCTTALYADSEKLPLGVSLVVKITSPEADAEKVQPILDGLLAVAEGNDGVRTYEASREPAQRRQ